MPFVTRDMCSYMKEKGLGDVQESEKRKIRNLPSSMDPISDCVELDYKNVHSRSKSSSTSTSNTSATSKSSATSNASKSKMSSTASSNASSASKSKTSSTASSNASAASKTKTSSMASSRASSKMSSTNSNKSLKAKLTSSNTYSGSSSSLQSKGSKSSTSTNSSKSNVKIKANLMNGEYQDKYKQLSFDEKTVRFVVALLRSNLKRIDSLAGAINKNDAKDFREYKIDFDRPIKPNTPGVVQEGWDDVVRVLHRNKEFRDFPLCCYIFNRKRTEPDSLYCRILQALSRKHPSIIQTWALFFDEKNIYVIQEFCLMGNLCKFVDSKSTSQQNNEATSVEIAQQLFKAMDYLGDLGISHRDIQPKNVFIAHRNPVRIKLAGFHRSIIYWDSRKENVILLSCVSLHKKSKEPEFQAPEVYGDEINEVFDPIYADIWSYGATIFYSLTGKYPYEFCVNNFYYLFNNFV